MRQPGGGWPDAGTACVARRGRGGTEPPRAGGSSSNNSSGSGSSSESSGKHYTIALVPGLTDDPFYITMHAGAAAEAKKLGVTLTWQGGTTFSPTAQLPVVNALLAKHPERAADRAD